MLDLLCGIALLGALLPGCGPGAPTVIGYVEGDYIQIAPLETAHVMEIGTERAAKVKKGDLLAVMENADAKLALQQADAQLAQLQSELANLKRGRRSEEVAVVEAALAQALAREADSRATLRRQKELFGRRVVSQANLDAAQTAVTTAEAAVAQQKANLAVAQLPARPDEIAAAEKRINQARASRDMVAWRVGQRELLAPADGIVTAIIRRVGETAGPAQPVLEMLPERAVKVLLHVPQEELSGFEVGRKLVITCDGCPAGYTATVSWRATEAEFTPPVIYSVESRQKLVYLVEARPDKVAATALYPGQIVDAALTGEP